MKDYLTEAQVVKVEAAVKDEELMDALEKIFLQGIYTHGTLQKGHKANPLHNSAFNLASLSLTNPIPDAEIGAHLRAMWAGVNYLKLAFDDLKKIKSGPIESPYVDENEAV